VSSAKLYNAELLGLATSLAAYPLDESQLQRGTARSPTCGSVVEISLALNERDAISRLGVKAQACAVGQAAAAILAAQAAGKSEPDFTEALRGIETWLSEGPLPAWPGFIAIAAARDYPARHGAILLPWRAALVAFAARG